MAPQICIVGKILINHVIKLLKLCKKIKIWLLINFEVKMSYGLLVILITHINEYKALTQALMGLSM